MLEAFSRSLSGSPAFLGSTTDGYYYDYFNCTYAKMLYDYMLINGDSLLGELTNLAHISNMNMTGSYLAIDNTFSYICGGDPALELWTDTAHVFGTVGLSEYNGNVKIVVKNNKIKVAKENSPKHLCSKQGYINNSTEIIMFVWQAKMES